MINIIEQDGNYIITVPIEDAVTAPTKTLLLVSSRISESRNTLVTDADGLNIVDSLENVEITVTDDLSLDLPIGSILMYKQNGEGNIIIKGGNSVPLDEKQTYDKDDVISLLKIGPNIWEYLNPPKKSISVDNLIITER